MVNTGNGVRMESLDGRVLLSASLSAGGTLTIAGSRRADVIEMRVRAADPTQFEVDFGSFVAAFPAAAVKRIDANVGLGDDSITLQNVDRPATILGGLGDDTIQGSNGNNRIDAEGGDDLVGAAGGNDTILGGDGADGVLAGNGNNVVDGGDGSDSLTTGLGNDLVSGGPRGDVITGGAGRDTLLGNNGDDVIDASEGSGGRASGGRVEGGSGADVILGAATVNLFGGRDNDLFRTPALNLVKDAAAGDRVELL